MRGRSQTSSAAGCRNNGDLNVTCAETGMAADPGEDRVLYYSCCHFQLGDLESAKVSEAAAWVPPSGTSGGSTECPD